MLVEWSDFQSLTDTNTDNVPEAAGVYLLRHRLNEDSWRVFYVGSTPNLRQTLKRHISASEPDQKIKRKVFNCILGYEYLEAPLEMDREGMVKYLIGRCKPEHACEVTQPDIVPLKVNLPGRRESASAWQRFLTALGLRLR